jgi:hypothetical protein
MLTDCWTWPRSAFRALASQRTWPRSAFRAFAAQRTWPRSAFWAFADRWAWPRSAFWASADRWAWPRNAFRAFADRWAWPRSAFWASADRWAWPRNAFRAFADWRSGPRRGCLVGGGLPHCRQIPDRPDALTCATKPDAAARSDTSTARAEQKKLGSLHRANRARKLPARPADGSSSQPRSNSTG